MTNSQLSLLCWSHVLGVENVWSALLIEGLEFPKCHVLHVLLPFSLWYKPQSFPLSFPLLTLVTSPSTSHRKLIFLPLPLFTLLFVPAFSYPPLLFGLLDLFPFFFLYILLPRLCSWDAMWWWILGVLSCILLVAIVIFFLTTGQRYKVFSEKSLRPPGPLVTDSRQRDDRLKRGAKGQIQLLWLTLCAWDL